MKKLLFAGIMLALAPFVSFAQTTATGTTPVPETAVTATPATIAPGLVPGDFFYFFDNWGENLRLTFTFNKESKAKLHLQYAKERVAEMKDVLKKPDAKLADIEDAKKNFDAQIADAATLVKSEKDNGADVAGLARELDDELDQSRTELKDVFHGHQDNADRAEVEIRAKIDAITASGMASSTGANELQGLTQALESITKEKGDANKEENDLDTNLSDEQALFEEIMGPQMSAEKHMEQAARFRDQLQAMAGQVPEQASAQLMKQAQEAMKRGDFETAKRMSKDAEHRLEKAREMRDGFGFDDGMPAMGMPNASGTMMNTANGVDVGASHLDDLESGIKEGERMMEGLNR